MKKLLAVFSCALPVCLAVACHDDDDHDHGSSTNASCTAIVEACHSKDTGSGPVHDCHEAAEAATATEATCAAQKDSCIATCNAAGTDAGATDGG